MTPSSDLWGESPFSPPPAGHAGFAGSGPFYQAPPFLPAFGSASRAPEFQDWHAPVDAKYELSKIVGSGSYGKVAEAFSRDGQRRRVAIKQCQTVFGMLKVGGRGARA